MNSIIRRIVLYIGTATITMSAVVMSVFAECISQKQRTAIDWNVQSMLGNESVTALAMLCAIVSMAVVGLVHKKHGARAGRFSSLGIYLPIAFLLLSLFQDDIFKSVVASIIYFALFAEIALLSVVEASHVLSGAALQK